MQATVVPILVRESKTHDQKLVRVREFAREKKIQEPASRLSADGRIREPEPAIGACLQLRRDCSQKHGETPGATKLNA